MKRGRDESGKPEDNPRDPEKFIRRQDLDPDDRKIFDALSIMEKTSQCWRFFDPMQQAVLSSQLKNVGVTMFNSLKNVYVQARTEIEKNNAIERSNRLGELQSYTPNQKQSGNLVVMFTSIGSGDCVLIQTPRGKTIVVDCGTGSTPSNDEEFKKRIQDRLASDLFLNGKGKSLYALILTHPDLDHYKLAEKIIQPCVGEVEHVFYSLKLNQYNSAKGSAMGFMKKAKVCNEVTINEGGVAITNESVYEVDRDNFRIKILGKKDSDKQWNEDNCEIYLLAAGVAAKAKDDEDEKTYKDGVKNAASIVVLIKAFGRKILLCGDATLSTEKFLTSKHNHKDYLKDVDLFQLEHHGAATEHAGDIFVKMVNPVLAVASAGEHRKFKHPQWGTIKKYADYRAMGLALSDHRLNKKMDAHPLKYGEGDKWTNKNDNDWKTSYSAYGVYSTDSGQQDLCFVVDRSGNLIREYTKDEVTYKYTVPLGGGDPVVTFAPVPKTDSE